MVATLSVNLEKCVAAVAGAKGLKFPSLRLSPAGYVRAEEDILLFARESEDGIRVEKRELLGSDSSTTADAIAPAAAAAPASADVSPEKAFRRQRAR